MDINKNDLKRWCDQYVPDWETSFGDIRHKKIIEFFCSYNLLRLCPKDILMDVAGGTYGYLKTAEVARRILQDRAIANFIIEALGTEVDYIESDAGNIPLPENSIDKISCHHSFEHFQNDTDIRFIREVKRILKPGGMCCIVPLFLTKRFYEITDELTLHRKYSDASTRIIDPTATLPGGIFSGNYARTYSMAAFNNHILDQLDAIEWNVNIVKVLLNGRPAPYPDIPCNKNVASVNFPYRCLLIKKKNLNDKNCR
ncbi:MAG: class I SAM-dependent methyltransferase [Syntrophaceae bacterium]|nr:class I SAM-dependent methyltransferase [Syntrophaceae bacterium]